MGLLGSHSFFWRPRGAPDNDRSTSLGNISLSTAGRPVQDIAGSGSWVPSYLL